MTGARRRGAARRDASRRVRPRSNRATARISFARPVRGVFSFLFIAALSTPSPRSPLRERHVSSDPLPIVADEEEREKKDSRESNRVVLLSRCREIFCHPKTAIREFIPWKKRRRGVAIIIIKIFRTSIASLFLDLCGEASSRET